MRGITRAFARLLVGLLVIVAGAGIGFPASAADRTTYTVESRLWFEGNSTLGKWACREVPVQGEVSLPEVPGGNDALAGLLEANPDTAWRPTLRFPVKTIGCEEGERMNNHMRTALKADEHPAVTFRVEAVRPEGRADTPAGALRADVEGSLTVSGTTRRVTVPVTLNVPDQDTPAIRIRGKHKLDMTEFDVSPPTLMYGTISVHKPVTVHADLELKPSE